MRRSALILPFVAVVALAASLGTPQAKGPDETEQTARTKFSAAFPGIPVSSVSTTPVPGSFEIVSGNNIFYYFPATGHVLAGVLWDAHRKNLTQERRDELSAAQISKIDLSKALKIGNGPNTVIEVTDPDCPYCRKGHDFLHKRTDITRYIFFGILAKHPEAPKKAQFILSSDNSEKALESVFAGKYDAGKEELPAFTDNGRFADHQRIVAGLGVTGTPQYWVNGKSVAGADLQKIEGLLGQKQAVNTNSPGTRSN